MKPLAQNTMIQNRYLIVQLIGKGGMGEVYLAVDQRLGSAVALKRTFFAGDEMLGNAFEREARILARMRHPVLPKVSDHFSEGDEQYLVMEHISGDDLAKRLEVAQKPFPLSWVMFWADQLLDALSYLHSHEPPIIHRDIKPQNLKLTDENHIVLLDFGLSKSSTGKTNISDVARREGSSSSSTTGSVVGYTPHYAPMEQIRGIGTNPRSDLYSLSATLYQLLANEVPADALTRADIMLNGSDDPIRALSDINPEISKAVSDVILKGMEVSQDRRFETAREMQKAMRKAFSSIQSAMSAHTVAFNVDADSAPATEQPIAPSMDKTEVMDFGRVVSTEPAVESVATRVTGDSKAAFDPNATVAFGQDFDEPIERQSDLKTEVFDAGSADVPRDVPEAEAAGSDNSVPAEPDFGMTRDFGSFNGEPAVGGGDTYDEVTSGSTSPVVSFHDQGADAGVSGDLGDYQDQSAEEDLEPQPAYAVAAAAAMGAGSQPAALPTPAKAKKKGSAGKIVGIFVGLFALFVLGLGVVGGGWWYYNNYYAGAVDPEPTPSPEATLEATPSPEPTFDVSIDLENSNSDIMTNANANVAGTPDPDTDGPGTTRPRQTPVTPRPTPVRRTPTPVKPTPAPTRDRTKILQ